MFLFSEFKQLALESPFIATDHLLLELFTTFGVFTGNMTTQRLGRLEVLLAVDAQELFVQVNFPLQALLGLLFLEAILLFHVVNQFFDGQLSLLRLIFVLCLLCLHQFVALLLLLEDIFVEQGLFDVWRKLFDEILVQLLLLRILFSTAQLDKGFNLVKLILILCFGHFSWLGHGENWCYWSHRRFGICDTLILFWRNDGCCFLLRHLVFDWAFCGFIALDHLFESIKLLILNFSGVHLSKFWHLRSSVGNLERLI